MLSVIGDVHNRIRAYNALTAECDYSVQIGDMGYNYGQITGDKKRHQFFGGNHEDYDNYDSCVYSMGDYGLSSLDNVSFFFARGAFSIDMRYQRAKNLWFQEEELSFRQALSCIELYRDIKPSIVLTHSCPTSIAKMVGNPSILKDFGFNPETFRTSTGHMLEAMFQAHQPDLWIFGHFHKSWVQTVRGTEFRCLNELERFDI